jgi:hypothetical protein
VTVPFKSYLTSIADLTMRGDAREESLTDFYEFRLYGDDVLLKRALLARSFIPKTLKTDPPAEQVEELTQLFETFFSFALPSLLYRRRPGA